MPEPCSRPTAAERIWLVDRRDYWRHRYQQILERHGYGVRSFDEYCDVAASKAEPRESPNLIVLVCGTIDREETQLTKRASQLGYDMLILSASLPLPAVRDLFLAGARDVAELPGSGERLLELVCQALTRSREIMVYRTPMAAPAK